MKKTLITLLALAGVASADTADAITLWNTGFSIESSGSWTLDEEITDYITSSAWSLKKANNESLLSTTTNSAELRPNTNIFTQQGWYLDFTLTNTSETAVIINSLTFDTLLFSGGGVYQSSTNTPKFNFTLTYGDNTVTEKDWLITGTGNANPDNGVVTLNFAEGIELAAEDGAINIRFAVDKGNYTNGCFIGLKTISASGVLVPEPATATLSLLALAGLAARRRRK